MVTHIIANENGRTLVTSYARAGANTNTGVASWESILEQVIFVFEELVPVDALPSPYSTWKGKAC